MTPQVQQGFAAPIIGAGVHAALAPDMRGEDGMPQTGQPSDDPCDSFGKLMQADAAAVLGIPVPVPQTGPQPVEFVAQAAVAMQMLSSPSDAEVQKKSAPVVVAPDLSALVEELDLELDAERDPAVGLADAFVVPLLVTAAPVENLKPAMPLAASKPDFAARVNTGHPPPAPPITPLLAERASPALGLTPIIAEPEIATADIAESIPTPLPTPSPVLVAIGPALITGPAISALQAMPAQPHHGVISASAPPTKTAKTAQNTTLEPLESAQQTTHATPAETAFRLRAGAGVNNEQTDALNLPPPQPNRGTPRPFAASSETALPDAPADPIAKPEALPDRAALPQTGFAADSALATPPIGGADQIKQTPVVITQPGTFHTASPPVTHALLPPRLSADLVALAKTTPSGPVEILLNPEELGQLRFEIHQKSDQLRVVLSVERPETMDFLRRNADQLLGEFRAAGFAGASLSFGQWDQQSSDPRPQPAPPPPAPERAFDPPPVPKPLPPPLQMATSTGLNMRL